MTKKLEEDYTVLEPYWYRTEIGESEVDCWRDLAKFLEDHAKWNMVFLREGPVVESNYDIRRQVTEYVGYVRFMRSPVKYEETLYLPSLGEAECKTQLN